MKLALLASLVLTTGAADTLAVADLARDKDKSQVTVSGWLIGQGSLGDAYILFQLCQEPGAKDLKGCVDLMIREQVAPSYIELRGHCVKVSGDFTSFGKDRVGTGNLWSTIGLIDVSSIATCHGL
jgi:hypothetical protein